MANIQLRVKQLLKQRGMTQEDLAKQLGIARQSLAQALSRNAFGMSKLAEIADALDVSIPELFEDFGTVQCPNCGKRFKP